MIKKNIEKIGLKSVGKHSLFPPQKENFNVQYFVQKINK